jgi:hypothetical protein
MSLKTIAVCNESELQDGQMYVRELEVQTIAIISTLQETSRL